MLLLVVLDWRLAASVACLNEKGGKFNFVHFLCTKFMSKVNV